MDANNYFYATRNLYEIHTHRDLMLNSLKHHEDKVNNAVKVLSKLRSDSEFYERDHVPSTSRPAWGEGYSTKVFGELFCRANIGDIDCVFAIRMMIRLGKLHGYNFDYHVFYQTDGGEYDQPPVFKDILRELNWAPLNLNQREDVALKVENWFTDKLPIIDFIEGVFKQATTY